MPKLPFVTTLRNLEFASQDDGFLPEHYEKLVLAQQYNEQVEVLTETCPGYYDVRLQDWTIVPALHWYHLNGFEDNS